VVANYLGPFVAQLPMVISMGFFLPSLIAKFPSLALGGIVSLISVPSLPFG
jgi:hypothetical protein